MSIVVAACVHRFGYAFEAPTFDGGSERASARLENPVRSYPLCDVVNPIGRDSRSAIALEARGVSRQHVRIRILGGSAAIEDMGSKNGTWVNGARITEPVRCATGHHPHRGGHSDLPHHRGRPHLDGESIVA